jgi:hypothetical protein
LNLEHNILDLVGKANKNSSIIVGESSSFTPPTIRARELCENERKRVLANGGRRLKGKRW